MNQHSDRLLKMFKNARDVKIVEELIEKLPELTHSSVKAICTNINAFQEQNLT